MKPTFNEKLIAYLTLFSGLAISTVAVYYSVVGLTAIFAAAVVPIIIMGVTLEVSKLIATLWLKQNWHIAPKFIKGYLIVAIVVLDQKLKAKKPKTSFTNLWQFNGINACK